VDLHFSWVEVEKLLDEVRAAKTANTLYDKKTGKGLWLVGDHGVYLMANTKDGPLAKARKEGDKTFVVYANECNPDKGDDWWDIKRASFGGDDGVEFLALAELEGLIPKLPQPNASPHALIIGFTPGKFSLGIQRRKAKATKLN
jgi:hypothetical protein